ncbi:MAG: hypothetical protein UZ12_BCD005003456 [Bacteroidetes bacterium OLB12]|nr:MAG: hypothetical protein UZ12_BCD005003456 [Bacteroidetes bacterium OLB12]HNR73758.1 hypothetical protein [Cyclobacteriaceae bacterium]
MSNFDLIDDYLTNRLSEAQKESFEQQLAADPSLKADVEFQRQIIESVKRARAAELKSMLNNIPISPVSKFTSLKVAAGIVGGALLIGSVYLFSNKEPEQPVTEPIDSVVMTESEIVSADINESEEVREEATTTHTQQKETSNKAETTIKAPAVKKEVAKPALEVIDPSAELVGSTSSPVNHGATIPTAPVTEVKSLEVAIDGSNKKYKFHYQFAAGKVVLYGSFDDSLYEIIELNGGKHAVYLYYQKKYYNLDDQATDITPLQVVTDKSILNKLENYRKK